MSTSAEEPKAPALAELRRRAGPALQADSEGRPLLSALIPGRRPALASPWREHDEAYARGQAEGRREGTHEAEAQLKAALEAVARVIDALSAAHAQTMRDRGRDLHALAMAVARHLVQGEVRAEPELVERLIVRALALLPDEPSFEVHVNPLDQEVVASRWGESGGPVPSTALKWVSDPALPRGGFRIETPRRIVDGRPDVALQLLYEMLEDE